MLCEEVWQVHYTRVMKVSYTHFSPDAPIRDQYQEGADYLTHHFDFGFDETLDLLKELKNHRSSVYVEAPVCSLDFYIESDGSRVGGNLRKQWSVGCLGD